MKLLFLISVVYQNGIIANIITQQLKDMQEQIDNLREAKVTLFADFEDQIANLTEKIATQAEQIAVQTDQIAYQATKIDIMQKQQVSFQFFLVKNSNLASKIPRWETKTLFKLVLKLSKTFYFLFLRVESRPPSTTSYQYDVVLVRPGTFENSRTSYEVVLVLI